MSVSAAIYGCGVAFVVWALPRRAGAFVAGIILAGMVGLSLGGLGLSVGRFYG